MNGVSPAMTVVDTTFEDEAAGDVVEITLAWGGDVLSTRHLAMGATLSVGEKPGCDLLIPAEILGATRAVILAAQDGRVVVTPPACATMTIDDRPCELPLIELAPGRVARVHIGAFAITASVVRESKAVAGSWLDAAKQAGFGGLGLSTLVHASLFAAFALFMPALGGTDDQEITRDQLLTMQRLMNATAEPEEQETSGAGAVDHAQSAEPTPSGGGRAQGASGAMGKSDTKDHGHWSAAGDAKPNEATLSREQKVAMVENFGFLGLLGSVAVSDPNAPAAPWGSTLNGSDCANHLGNLWAGDAADSFGIGGLGLSGGEEGGGGNNIGVGLADIGGLGHSLDTRIGSGDPGGFGCKAGARCTGRVNGEHHRAIDVRMPREITTNGRLPSEVIQRVVRQNAGRFRLCYESGLRGNPALEGRVGVQFIIDRNGAVSVAQDSGSDLPDVAVRKCVVQGFYNLSFPSPDNGTVTVLYPLVFTPAN